ncbi:hypothetical protein [Rhizobium sp. NFACC06-2]|uniref:hypothetical protein n=1 Tax=Rhizobium sp. NFACC06-2 TaxID=1566264 RepID=UPI000876D120|nr:hypothetical protein [Rhizobium sp. NFACC06-2]SCY92345.1 hypothetical protein SAMN03159288_05268 [Rhizobium sp. NFACC06-2]
MKENLSVRKYLVNKNKKDDIKNFKKDYIEEYYDYDDVAQEEIAFIKSQYKDESNK